MPTNNDYRKLIEEKFKGVYARMDSNFELIHQKLSSIDEQTKKTNGRVNKLEDEVEKLKLYDSDHLTNCPQIERINKIDESLIEYKFMRKYPKLSLIVITTFGLFMIIYTLVGVFKS